MTPEELTAAASRLKEDYERETVELQGQIDRTRAKINRLETRLAVVRDQYQHRWGQLYSSFVGGEAPKELLSPSAGELSPGTKGRKRRRGSLDEPVLALARELFPPAVSAGRLVAAWNQRTPDNGINDSTVRSILDRLETKGFLVVENEGGGKGSGIPRTYRPA